MRHHVIPGRACFLASAALATIITAVATLHLNRSGDVPKRQPDNNPDKFHLAATNSTYDYSFTYDPLAADQWRFESGGVIVADPPQRH